MNKQGNKNKPTFTYPLALPTKLLFITAKSVTHGGTPDVYFSSYTKSQCTCFEGNGTSINTNIQLDLIFNIRLLGY